MSRRFVTLTAAAVLWACSALPSFADHHGGGHGGGGSHGGAGIWSGAGSHVAGGWHGGVGNWNGGGWHSGGAGMAVAAIGTAVVGMAGVVAGIITVTVAAGQLA